MKEYCPSRTWVCVQKWRQPMRGCLHCYKWLKEDTILQTVTILGTKGGCPWPK